MRFVEPAAPGIRVSLISVTPVKCFALSHPESIQLTRDGVLENRRFLLIDGAGKRLRSSLTSWPMVVRAEYDAGEELLRLRFPDGELLGGSALGSGEPITVDYHGTSARAHVVPGAW